MILQSKYHHFVNLYNTEKEIKRLLCPTELKEGKTKYVESLDDKRKAVMGEKREQKMMHKMPR